MHPVVQTGTASDRLGRTARRQVWMNFLRRKTPFVGFRGRPNSLAVVRAPDRLVCQLTGRMYGYMVAMCALFGPGLSALLWVRPDGMQQHLPVFITALLWSLSMLCWAFLARYLLFGAPRIEVPYASGDVVFFRTRGSRPTYTIHRADIDRFDVAEESYLDEGTRIPNYAIWLVTRTRDRVPLCVSTDQMLIRQLMDDLRRASGGESPVPN